MKWNSAFLVALLVVGAVGVSTAPPAAAQQPADTLSYGLFRARVPVAFVRGLFVSQVVAVRTGPDSAVTGAAGAADSIILPPINLKGYSLAFDAWGTTSTNTSNAKSVVVKMLAAGATTTIDSMESKKGGINWHSHCELTIRNANSGAATGDSTQVLSCTHIGSGDSSTTATAAPLVTTLKLVPAATGNVFRIVNSTGTAKGDVVVTRLLVTGYPGGRVNP
jgi:hypothetical protein